MKIFFQKSTIISCLIIILVAFVLPSKTNSASLLTNNDIDSLIAGQNLAIGSNGSAVSLLQNFLVHQGKLIYPEQLVSGYFGSLTQKALTRFQNQNGIYPASGYFGPLTKKFIGSRKALYVLNTNQGISIPKPNLSTDISINTISAATIDKDVSINISALGISSNVDYVNALFDISKNIQINSADISGVMKKGNTPLTIAGAIDKKLSDPLVSTENLNKTLSLWKKIFNQSEIALESRSVSQDMADYHRKVVGWFRYSEKISDEAMMATSTAQLKIISDQYRATYEAYGKSITQNLKLSGIDKIQIGINYWQNFLYNTGLAKKVLAAGPLYFGGTITIGDVCLTGEFITVSPPSPGFFFLYWPIYALNPYLYDVVADGNWILGMAIPIPGLCTHSAFDYYTAGQGTIAYFGTAAQ